MHFAGAIVFFLLAVLSGTYGVINLITVQQTIFGPAKVGTALPVLQLLLALLCVLAALASVKACTHCWKLRKTD